MDTSTDAAAASAHAARASRSRWTASAVSAPETVSAAVSLATDASLTRETTTRYPSAVSIEVARVLTARATSFSRTLLPPAEPTTPGSTPPCPASMNTVLPRPAPRGAKLMQASVAIPSTARCVATGAEPWAPASGSKCAMTMAPIAATASASSSVARKTGEGPSRRGRGGTLRAFAIGRDILASVSGTPAGSALPDPAVLRGRDFLSRRRIEIQDGEDDHEGLVLPDGDVVGLGADRLGERHGVRGQPVVSP